MHVDFGCRSPKSIGLPPETRDTKPVPDLGLDCSRLAQNIDRDLDVIGRPRDLARSIVADDPQHEDPAHATMHAEVVRRFADDLEGLEALETG